MNSALSKVLYRILQSFRGEPVFRVLKDIEKSQWLSVEELRTMQLEKLKRLVNFAYENVPYYKTKWDSEGISPQKIRDLQDFAKIPSVTKREIQENTNLFYPIGKSIKFTIAKTSGSTGTPLSIRMSQLSWAYHHANIIRAMSWHGLDYFAKEVRIGSQSSQLKKRIQSNLVNKVCNRIFIAANNMSDQELGRQLEKIYRFKPLFIYGYPTALKRFATFVEQVENLPGSRKLKINFAISHGEELEDQQRDYIERSLRCHVINGYGAAEVGIIAYECPKGTMHIPAESIYVESMPLDMMYGNGCKELVVTDLNNYAMPLIRYRIGDLGEISDSGCPCGRGLPTLIDLKGKIRDLIETPEGKKVHTVIFNDIFKDLLAKGGKVYEWQVIQQGPIDFLIKIVKGDYFNDSHTSFLRNMFHKYLGSEIRVSFEFVPTIKKHQSGKFRAFIREFNEKD